MAGEDFRRNCCEAKAAVVLEKLQNIEPDLKVGGLIELGLSEGADQVMKESAIAYLMREAIKRFAKEGERERKKMGRFPCPGRLSSEEELN